MIPIPVSGILCEHGDPEQLYHRGLTPVWGTVKMGSLLQSSTPIYLSLVPSNITYNWDRIICSGEGAGVASQ